MNVPNFIIERLDAEKQYWHYKVFYDKAKKGYFVY